MDFSGSEHYDDFEETKRGGRGCFGRLVLFLVSLVAVLILVVGGVAIFLSTDLGRLWVINKINRAITPAHLSVDKWDAALFGSAKLEGVEYVSPEDGLSVDAPSVVFSKGVLAFIPVGKLTLGDITINSPVITIDPSEAEKKQLSKKSGKEDIEKGSFFIPVADVGGALFIKNGAVIVNNQGRSVFESDAIDGHLLVNSIWKPCGFEVKGRAGSGVVGLTGDLQSIASLSDGGDSDYTDKIVLQLDKVDLSAFTPLLIMLKSPVLPHAGVAEGALTLERSGDGALLKAKGGLLIENMQLITGEEEYSPAGDVALLVDAELKDELCVFRKFDFSSPWGRIKLTGSFRQVDEVRRIAGDVDANIDLDIAAVTRDFRYALDIDDELSVPKGRLTGYLKMKSAKGGLRLDTSLKTSQLAMIYKNRPVSIDRDPSLVLKMYFPDDALPEVEELRVRGSFADVYGKGNIKQGVLKGYVDFSQFSQDFKGLLKNGTVLGGAAHFNFSTRPSGDNVAFDLITKFSKFNVTSPSIGASSVKEGSFTCRGSAVGAATAKRAADLSLNDVDYDLRLNKNRVSGSIKRFIPVQGGKVLPVLRGFNLSADLDVADTVKACGAMMKRKAYIDALSWRGSVLANAAVESANSVAKIRVNGAGRDIAFKIADQVVNEPDIRFGGAATFDAEHDTLQLDDVDVSSDVVDITAKGDVRDFWKSRIADLSGDMDLKFNSVDRMLRVRGIDEWKLIGHKKSPFKLKGPLTPAFTQRGYFSGEAYLASLTGLGLNAEGAGISLDMNKGRLEADWRPVLNGGRLRFTPIFDFSTHGVTVRMPDGIQLLERVKITQDMVDKLLVHFNPMFHGSRVHKGFVNLKVNSFSSGPKPGYSDLMIDCQTELEDLSMTLSPAMRDLLKMINVNSSTYQVKHLPMHAVVRKERVYLDRLTMNFSKQPVVFSGSVGFDSTINYLIEIPLGDTISRKTGLNLPKGLTVKVKVTGTVDNPRLDTSALQQAFGGFIKNTLGDDALKGVTDFLDQLKKELR